MKSFALCVAICLFYCPAFADDEDASRVLDGDLKTWSRLKRDAGYYTESGQWRGGLYQHARSTETEKYKCLNSTDTHCIRWNVDEVSSKKHETGICECKETDSAFCRQWNCSTSLKYDCSTKDHQKTCVEHETSECICTLISRNERYCRKWSCREEGDYLGGYHELEDYECVVIDISEQYCFRWKGNTSSNYVLESSMCQCFSRSPNYCEFWQCRERGIFRCDHSHQGWCMLEIAIGVGGGMGLLLFVISLLSTVYFCFERRGLPLRCVLLNFVVLCLPWIAGVLIWGGIFGLPWVLGLWSVALVSAICFVKCKNKERGVKSIELPIGKFKDGGRVAHDANM